MSTSPIEVTVLGQVLRLGCPAEQHDFLRQAAQDLDERVLKMKERTGILSTERVLSIVALNLSYELMQAKEKHKSVEDIIAARIQQLDSSLEQVNLQKNSERFA
ncbi:cell division protein ZapA [Actinobacillus delphinicola]|uniref:Cell division protein ZapA n=1 Tax=Actinobacillus delphinicola TaxID=51161 RepID=A0A448TU61_9PAST|nr:cell division protein ZapA [Actinobacillus delphinicola]VEJ09537.1 cell division protein ZapA [Actinobacillus delphinicola]